MDITNEQKKLNDPTTKSSLHHAAHSSPSCIIPEMVITSADGFSECETNVSECTIVLIPPSTDHSIETSLKDSSTEFTKLNTVSEKSDVDFEAVSTVVKDIVSKCTDSVSHSIHQRPLRMEIDKNVEQQENLKNAPVKSIPSPPPPPPPPQPSPPPPSNIISTPLSTVIPASESPSSTISPTAMQRPLIFGGVVPKVDSVTETQENVLLEQTPTKVVLPKTDSIMEIQESISLKQASTKKKELVSQGKNEGALINAEISVEKSSEECKSPTKKEGLHGVKKFFDSILHQDTQQTTSCSEVPESPKDHASTDTPKSAKSSIKSFFHSPKSDVTKTEQPSSIELQNESKELESVSKQSKRSFFDAFRHENIETKEPSKKTIDKGSSKDNSDSEKNSPLSANESPKISSFAKDTKQNIKAFFDTLRHEPSEQKPSNNVVPSINISSEKENYAHSSTPENSEESGIFSKDTKQNKKTFFSSFKHEPEEHTSKSTTEKSLSQPNIRIEDDQNIESSRLESPKETSSFVKDTKQNIKSFFDTFKHEPSEIKQKNATCKKSNSHPDFSQDSKETNINLEKSSEKIKHKESFAKNAKQNVKTFFDSFKHDENTSKPEVPQKEINSSGETAPTDTEAATKDSGTISKDTGKFKTNIQEVDKLSAKHKEPTSPTKDNKQSIKAFFDNFKLGDININQNEETSSKTIPESNLHEGLASGTVVTSGDSRHSMKTFDSFKLGDLNAESKNKEISLRKRITSEPELNKESPNETSTYKESKHPVKKFFSFKQSKENDECRTSANLDNNAPKKSEKDKPAKIVKSVKLDLHPKYSNGADNVSASFSEINGHEAEIISEIKERAQSVPVDPCKSKPVFSSLEKKPEISASNLTSPDGHSVESKGSCHSMKKFFESFKSEKSDTDKSCVQSDAKKKENLKEKNTIELLAEDEESKIVEKPTKEKKNKSIRRSLSDKINREEVVQNFKGFFDSLGHKSSSKKSIKDSEHIYDVVEVKPEMDIPVTTINISSEVYPSKNRLGKDETQEMKKQAILSQSKDASKSGSESIFISESKLEKKKEKKLPREVTSKKTSDQLQDTAQSSSSVVEDSSQTVSEPSSPKPDKNVFNAIGENILALKEKMLHPKEKRKSGLNEDIVDMSEKNLKINELSKDQSQETNMASIRIEQNQTNDGNADLVTPEKQTVELPKSQTSLPVKEKSNTHPNSLYDTCCIKLAFLLRDKALEVVSAHTKSPPPKPPKPSAEAIAKARAAAIARKIETQKLSKSFGEHFPISYDGMRFADDETESSCDYKDVENFDYIMDYELINRYKIDSSKLDTFSVPSTCSGLTSYYTADSIMETISLSSDISYSFKQIPSSNKNEIKTSALDENKKSKLDSSSKVDLNSKQFISKKVPPPIPPKPVILQNISKVKEKSDDKALSQCVNGLSLSPRLQNKFTKDPAVTQKRPLLVADMKKTQFSSLQHPKKPPKPARNFDTVLKNGSLKNVPSVSSDNVSASAEKICETYSSSQYGAKIEKRTKSPPRPPPPNILKKPEKPPKPDRPPPPVTASKSIISEEISEKILEKAENEDIQSMDYLKTMEKSDLKELDLNIKPDFESPVLVDKDETGEVISSDVVYNEKTQVIESHCDSNKSDFRTLQDSLNNNYEMEKDIASNISNTEIISSDLIDKPKPPPRNRRIRSRTVEIVPTEKQEEKLKRSSSLSDIDVQKRVTFLEAEKAKLDSKSLYTTINKNGKKSNYERTSQSSPDLVSGRPLPPPPPPPRRFRSLERKNKSKKIIDKKVNEQTDSVSEVTLDCSKDIKPPARRRKTDKERFLSLHIDRRKEITVASENLMRAQSVPTKPERRLKSSTSTKYDVNANIATFHVQHDYNSSNQSIPNTDTTDYITRSNPKYKSESESRRKSNSSWYDEDEALGDSWEVVDTLPSHGSSVEYKESPKVPLRRKPATRRKSKEKSKFYVNMEEDASTSTFEERTPSMTPVDKRDSPLLFESKAGSPLPLVDKETSPLPLDCSEKSVQTSLETLSQGIVSRDEQSEDTDELLDLAQTLQKELSTIISRHKSITSNLEDTPSPPLSAATSEKNLIEDLKDIKKTPSVRSSTSEVWPVTSSDESDVERVEDSSNLSEISVKRKQKKIFYIAREIMTSEETFVDALKLLNVDFKAAIEAANRERNMSVIPDETLAQILNHLPQLQQLNENLLMELKDRIENWDKHEKIADIIVKMGPFLKLYCWYIHDFESNVSLLKESKKKYPAFAQVVKEFEMSERCKKLALNFFMLRPIQRIPQYRLLLQEYLHQLTEDSKDYQDTVAALQIVSDVANRANNSMKHGDNAQKLISIQNSIVGHKEIVKPGRVFIKEGELMKLSRKGMQPRWFVLLNDLLLYLTPVQQGLYRVNHELPLTGMKVAIPIQQDYQNEFSIISVTRSFTLAARSPEERQEWIIALTKAIEENASKRSTFTNSRLHQKAHDKTSSEEEAAFVLGKKAPVWIPDARVTMCQLCTSEFTVTFRRHHCRACGKVICSICSSHRISLPYLGNRIARVCDECHARLGQGSSACTESGETDSDNQQIAVKPHLRTDNRHIKKKRPSVLKEVCANDQGSTISGYLHKKTGKSWKRDWFVVKDKVLYEYKASEDIAALRSTPLLGYEIETFNEAHEGIDSSLLFQLTHPGQAAIIFYADTPGSTERWISALKTATVLE